MSMSMPGASVTSMPGVPGASVRFPMTPRNHSGRDVDVNLNTANHSGQHFGHLGPQRLYRNSATASPTTSHGPSVETHLFPGASHGPSVEIHPGRSRGPSVETRFASIPSRPVAAAAPTSSSAFVAGAAASQAFMLTPRSARAPGEMLKHTSFNTATTTEPSYCGIHANSSFSTASKQDGNSMVAHGETDRFGIGMGQQIDESHPVRKAVARTWFRMGKVKGGTELAATAGVIVAAGFHTKSSLENFTDDVACDLKLSAALAEALRSDSKGRHYKKSGRVPKAQEAAQFNHFDEHAKFLSATAGHPSLKETVCHTELNKNGSRGGAISTSPVYGGFPSPLRDYKSTTQPPPPHSLGEPPLSPQMASHQRQLQSPRGVSCFHEAEEHKFVPAEPFSPRQWSPQFERRHSVAEARSETRHVARQSSVRRANSADGFVRTCSSFTRSSSYSFPRARGRCVAGMGLPQRSREQGKEIALTLLPDKDVQSHRVRRAQSCDSLQAAKRSVSKIQDLSSGTQANHSEQTSQMLTQAVPMSNRSFSRQTSQVRDANGLQDAGSCRAGSKVLPRFPPTTEPTKSVTKLLTGTTECRDSDQPDFSREELAEQLMKVAESNDHIGRMIGPQS